MKAPISYREKTQEDRPTKETTYRQRKASYLPTDLTTPSGRAQFRSTFASFSGGSFAGLKAEKPEETNQKEKPHKKSFLGLNFVSLSHRSSSNKKENTANPTSTDEHPKIEFNLGDFHLGSSRQRTNNAGTYKIDLNTAAQFMKKKRSVAENNANTFRENSTEKKNFFSFMGRSTSGQKSDPKTTLQTEVDTPKKKWRMFSFDRNSAKKSVEKLTTEANLAPTISGRKEYFSTKEELKILDRKASKGTLTIRPNYYMKNLEYFYPQQKDDYFAKLYKEHFQLSLNSMKFIKMLNLDLVEKFLESHKLALKKRVFCNSIK